MPFSFEPTDIDGLCVVRSQRFTDDRGWFAETYQASPFAARGIGPFVQDNHSSSAAGVIRGLHFQRQPAAQAKLVRVSAGRAWDVAVDLRRGSETFGRWHAIELDGERGDMLYIPVGFAHGFYALTDVQLSYKCSAEYAPECDDGVRFDDPQLAIPWPTDGTKPLLSSKDAALPPLSEAACFD